MQPQLVPVIRVVRPDGVGILENKVFVRLLMIRLIEVVEILDEDTFELRAIITTTLRCLTVLFVKDPLIIYIGSSIGIDNCLSLSKIGGVVSDLVKVG